jgi:putative hemolysin
MPTLLEPARLLIAVPRTYATRLARDASEVRAAQVLRYRVFNLELNEGLVESALTGRDEDPFDGVCDHLLVEHLPTQEIVGTYRLQTGLMAAQNRGYYSEQEFEFAPFEAMRSEMIELGRACVHQQHRNVIVLGMLWKGIADYARARRGRYLCGCSSLASQDPAVGASAYADLCRRNLAPMAWRTHPLPAYECALDFLAEELVKIPKLLRAYLSMGAKVCGPPAIDREFKTIDFLTLLDLEALPPLVRGKLFS